MPEIVYGVVGTGRWGSRLIGILSDLGRRALPIELSRRVAGEGDTAYRNRIAATLDPVGGTVNVIWLAVPPGDQFALVDAALDRNWHIVAEKPWGLATTQTVALRLKAQRLGLQIGIHHQFCYLSALPEMAKAVDTEDGPAAFSGVFNIGRENRLGLDPLRNLACHLLAIRDIHFPAARVVSIEAAYNSADHRSITLRQGALEYGLDFTTNKEPLVQNFIIDFEKAVRQGTPFRIGLELAQRVHGRIEEYEASGVWQASDI